MKERIEEILLKLQLSSAQFADIIGVQRSSISHILSGRNKPSFDFIHKILLKYPEINANWLITGQGSIDNELSNVQLDKNEDSTSDLFNQPFINKDLTGQNTQKDNVSNNQNTINNSYQNNSINSKFTDVNNVKSIVFIYNDDSFKIINSR